MNVGVSEFNNKITIVNISIVYIDGFQEEQETDLFDCYCKATNISGKELFKAKSYVGELKTRFLVRYKKEIMDNDIKVRFKDKLYNITYKNNYGYENKYIELWGEVIE